MKVRFEGNLLWFAQGGEHYDKVQITVKGVTSRLEPDMEKLFSKRVRVTIEEVAEPSRAPIRCMPEMIPA